MIEFDPRKPYLASASPRRLALMQQVGFDPIVCIAQICEERQPKENAKNYVQRLAKEKALAVSATLDIAPPQNPFVIAADTVVALHNAVLEKPNSPQQARSMLQTLSGNTHQVFTGVAILDRRDQRLTDFVAATSVTFYTLSNPTIEHYIDTGEPFDKAGAYGIQGVGAALVESIQGSYSNVVGLPIARLLRALHQRGAIPIFPMPACNPPDC